MAKKSVTTGVLAALFGIGCSTLPTVAPAAPFDISVILGDLGINLSSGWPQQYSYFQPPPTYNSYYSQPLYAQYIL